MRLYGATPSPFFRKCVVVLEEKGIPYDVENLAPFPKTDELMSMHPMGKIPILRDGDTVVPDSSVICAYLERKHPSPSIYPEDPAEFARALFIEEYCDTKVVEGVGQIFFERFVKPNVFQQETDEARVSELLATDVPPVLDWLEKQLPGDGDTLLSRFSIADAALGAHLGGLHFANERLDTARWPRLAAYLETLFARPSFKTAMGAS
jgi:glutathione S-transferase